MKGIKPKILVSQILLSSQIFLKNFTHREKLLFFKSYPWGDVDYSYGTRTFRILFLSEELQFCLYFVGPTLYLIFIND